MTERDLIFDKGRVPFHNAHSRLGKRVPLNRAKNSKVRECGHEQRYFVLGECLRCKAVKN